MYHISFIHPSADGHLGCFRVLAAVNIGLHISFQIRLLSGYMSRRGIAGAYGNSIFSSLRHIHLVLCSALGVHSDVEQA